MNKKIKIGVTGHRTVDDSKGIIQILKTELNKLFKIYSIESVLSPLAEGSDRIVAQLLMNEYKADLIVPLPFAKHEYKKDFSADSIKIFDRLIDKSSSVYEVDSLENHNRDECYLQVGKEVVNQCDVLIALWDGKPAEGIGGTGDVVTYAQENGKTVLHIDTTTLKVNKINFEGEE